MKKFNRKNVIIIGVILCVCILGYVGYRYTSFQQASKQYIADIDKAFQNYENINVEDDYGNKLDKLSQLLAVKSDKKVNKKSNTFYDDKVTQAKNKLISYYESVLKSQTLDKLDEITDKTKITKAKKGLDELKSKINDDKVKELSIFQDNKGKEELVNSIETLIKKYDDRLKAIKEKEEKEAEERKKAEEEAKKLEEQQAAEEANKLSQQQSQTQNSQSDQTLNNNTNNSNNQQNQNNQSSNSNSNNDNRLNEQNNASTENSSDWKKPWFTYHWQYDLETGEIIPGTEFWHDPQTDNLYDLNGNFIGYGTY